MALSGKKDIRGKEVKKPQKSEIKSLGRPAWQNAARKLVPQQPNSGRTNKRLQRSRKGEPLPPPLVTSRLDMRVFAL